MQQTGKQFESISCIINNGIKKITAWLHENENAFPFPRHITFNTIKCMACTM